jgi:hypothetical protein
MAAKKNRRARPARHATPQGDVPLRYWTILAHDPSIQGPRGAAVTTQVAVPAERLEPGPKGHRVHVVDFDASSDRYYRARMTDVVTALETDSTLTDTQDYGASDLVTARSILLN